MNRTHGVVLSEPHSEAEPCQTALQSLSSSQSVSAPLAGWSSSCLEELLQLIFRQLDFRTLLNVEKACQWWRLTLLNSQVGHKALALGRSGMPINIMLSVSRYNKARRNRLNKACDLLRLLTLTCRVSLRRRLQMMCSSKKRQIILRT